MSARLQKARRCAFYAAFFFFIGAFNTLTGNTDTVWVQAVTVVMFVGAILNALTGIAICRKEGQKRQWQDS